MSADLSQRLRNCYESHHEEMNRDCADQILEAAGAIDALTARVAQLEACLTDTVQQLELGGVTE